MIAVLIWLGLSNFSSTLKVDRKGLSIGTVEKAQFNDYVSVDGQVVPISVVQISSEEGGIVLEKVVDEGAHVNKGDVIVKLSNSNLDLEILNAESELAEKQDMLRNTQISMEQDRLNNSNEELSLSQDPEHQRIAPGGGKDAHPRPGKSLCPRTGTGRRQRKYQICPALQCSLHPHRFRQQRQAPALSQPAAHGHRHMLCSQRFCLRQLPCMAIVKGVVLCNDTGKFHR